MEKLNITTAFNRYGAKLVNPNWAVSSFNEKGELVVSCWKHYIEFSGGKAVCVDRLSRWSDKSPGNNLLRRHLEEAFDKNAAVRLVMAVTEETAVVDSGADASSIKKYFLVRPNLVGRILSFDGDEFQIEFLRES
jgi:hypothetical protein